MKTALIVIVALVGGAGCGPYIDWRGAERTVYQSEERCAQGPFDIEVEMRGARWGERVSLVACTPRAITGKYQFVDATGAVLEEGDWGTSATHLVAQPSGSNTVEWTTMTEPENSFCRAGSGEAGVASPGLAAAPAVTQAATDGAVQGGVGVSAPGAGMLLLRVPNDSDVRYPSPCHALRVELAGYGKTSDDPDGGAPFEAGARITIKLWSLAPNDLEGVEFFVEHQLYTPSVSDAEWIATLRTRHEQETRRQAEVAARQAREQEARRLEREASERRAAERLPFCLEHEDDLECWGPGGLAGLMDRMEAEYGVRPVRCTSRDRCEFDSAAYDAARAREAEAERRRVAAQPAAAPPPPAPVDPGIPPAPRVEVRPMQPAADAAWIAGRWQWSGTVWLWTGGWWRVPERAPGAAPPPPVVVATAPPPPRAETRPPKPADAAIWVAGSWSWSGSAWTWVDGSWQLPPSAGLSWTPPSVSIGAGGVTLVPGGWR